MVFFIFGVLPVLVSFTRKLEVSANFPYLTNLEELVLLLLLPRVVIGFRQITLQPLGLIAIGLYSCYWFTGLVSGLLASAPLKPLLFQSVLDLRLPLVLCVIAGTPSLEKLLSQFAILAKIVLVACVPLILWQYLNTESYNQIFPMGSHKQLFLLGPDLKAHRAVGIFRHPSELAAFSAFFVVYFGFYYTQANETKQLLWCALSVCLLTLSLQRLEIVGLLFSFATTVLLFSQQKHRLIAFGSVSIIGIIFSFALIYQLPVILEQYNITEFASAVAARTVFYVHAFVLAEDFFPIGTGFGTYGGWSAAIFGSQFYDLFSFDRYWWFVQNKYLVDTYWPHVIGETGVLGSLFLFAFILDIFAWLLWSGQRIMHIRFLHNQLQPQYATQAAFSMLVFVLINSLASSNLMVQNDIFLGFLLAGYIWQTNYRYSVNSRTMPRHCIK